MWLGHEGDGLEAEVHVGVFLGENVGRSRKGDALYLDGDVIKVIAGQLGGNAAEGPAEPGVVVGQVMHDGILRRLVACVLLALGIEGPCVGRLEGGELCRVVLGGMHKVPGQEIDAVVVEVLADELVAAVGLEAVAHDVVGIGDDKSVQIIGVLRQSGLDGIFMAADLGKLLLIGLVRSFVGLNGKQAHNKGSNGSRNDSGMANP